MRVLLALGLLFVSLGTHAVEYRFYSAAGVKAPLTNLSEIFNRNQSGYRIVNDFDTAGAAEKKFSRILKVLA
ncbi:hypothetical protein [Polynucleobacter necessarius]|uniref:hypothetical protein n=1 Tax=Polynucleobacter necessarius TaxID=576610 RepID=UPI000E09035C|nr:hypothetical protein [Polynucleobacter necessarius]